MLYWIVILSSFVFSCSSGRLGNKPSGLSSNWSSNSQSQYDFSDLSGQYSLKLEKRIDKKNRFRQRSLLFEKKKSETLLEKVVAVAQLGKLEGQNGPADSLMLPLASQYTVWYDGKKYFSQMRLNRKKRAMSVFNFIEGTPPVESLSPFPKGKVFCFFSQIPDCLRATGFISEAIRFGGGTMKFWIIWENYPFHTKQYTNFDEKVFSSAVVTFENTVDNLFRFEIQFSKQSLFYLFDQNQNFAKMYWVTQGLSIVPSGQNQGQKN